MRGGQGAGFLRLAVPMVVSRAGLAGMGIADGVMVARYSPAQLAPLGLSDGTLGRLLDVLVALLIGGIVLAAQAQAGSTPHEAGAVWRRAVRLALVTGLAAAAVGLAGPWWLGWLGEAPKLVAATAPVMAVLGAGMPLALVAVATAVFLEAVGRAPVVAAAVAAANVLNIALNWLLIGGRFGLPALGALGSALSTAAVRVALAGVLVGYAWRLRDHARLGVRRAPEAAAPVPVASGAEQRRLGYGAAAIAVVMNLTGMSMTVLAGRLGVLPLAAMTALWNALSIGALVALGMADAVALRVAAAQAPGGAVPGGGGAQIGPLAAALLGLRVAMPAVLALMLPLLLAPALVAGVYAPHGAMRAALAGLLPLGALVLLCDATSFVFSAGLRGLRDALWPAVIQAAVAAVLVPLAWFLAVPCGFGARGLVSAILVTSVMRAALMASRFRRRAGAGTAAGLAAPWPARRVAGA